MADNDIWVCVGCNKEFLHVSAKKANFCCIFCEKELQSQFFMRELSLTKELQDTILELTKANNKIRRLEKAISLLL